MSEYQLASTATTPTEPAPNQAPPWDVIERAQMDDERRRQAVEAGLAELEAKSRAQREAAHMAAEEAQRESERDQLTAKARRDAHRAWRLQLKSQAEAEKEARESEPWKPLSDQAIAAILAQHNALVIGPEVDDLDLAEMELPLPPGAPRPYTVHGQAVRTDMPGYQDHASGLIHLRVGERVTEGELRRLRWRTDQLRYE